MTGVARRIAGEAEMPAAVMATVVAMDMAMVAVMAGSMHPAPGQACSLGNRGRRDSKIGQAGRDRRRKCFVA